MSQLRDVEFTVDDRTVLRGWIHGDPKAPAPGVVMAHGFGGVKSQIAHYAQLFADAGLAVLLYDHRGIGKSDGRPRQEIDPYRQIDDWRDAITFAETQPEFDAAAGFGLWGSSFAGGLAMVIGSIDRRVRCVVAQIPNVSGHRNGPLLFGPKHLAEIKERGEQDRRDRLKGKVPQTVPVFTTDPDELCSLPPAVSAAYIEQALAGPGSWQNEVTLRSMEHLLEFEPAGWIPYLSPTPLLMVIAENDVCTFTDIQLEVYETAGEPKKLVTHPGGHFETYTTYFEQSGPPARDWFVQHLT